MRRLLPSTWRMIRLGALMLVISALSGAVGAIGAIVFLVLP